MYRFICRYKVYSQYLYTYNSLGQNSSTESPLVIVHDAEFLLSSYYMMHAIMKAPIHNYLLTCFASQERRKHSARSVLESTTIHRARQFIARQFIADNSQRDSSQRTIHGGDNSQQGQFVAVPVHSSDNSQQATSRSRDNSQRRFRKILRKLTWVCRSLGRVDANTTF